MSVKDSELKCGNCPTRRCSVTCLNAEPVCPSTDDLRRRTIKVMPKENDHD